MAAVRDNKARQRFELDVEDQIAFANYRQTPQAVIITHTETPRSLRGRGVASELVKGALEMIRADGHKVIAGCGFCGGLSGQAPGIPRPRGVGRSEYPIDMSGNPSSLQSSTSGSTPKRPLSGTRAFSVRV